MKIDFTRLPVLEGVVAFLLIAMAVGFMLAFMSTSGDELETPANGNGGNGEPTATPDNGNGGNGDQIAVDMGDNFFDPDAITVSAGQTVTFDLTNIGGAIHNMRIAGEDGEYNTDDDAVSDPEVISGGESGTLTWTAPDAAGEIVFQCDFHPTDMVGTITVE